MVKVIIDHGIVACYRRSVLGRSPKGRVEGQKAEERKRERGGNRTMAYSLFRTNTSPKLFEYRQSTCYLC